MEAREIGKRIRQKRLEYSWSQEEFAEKTGLSPVYIGMIERGEKMPRLETFIKIVNTLNASSDEILEDVINQGFKVKLTKYNTAIEKLNSAERKRIYAIIEAFLQIK